MNGASGLRVLLLIKYDYHYHYIITINFWYENVLSKIDNNIQQLLCLRPWRH